MTVPSWRPEATDRTPLLLVHRRPNTLNECAGNGQSDQTTGRNLSSTGGLLQGSPNGLRLLLVEVGRSAESPCAEHASLGDC